MVNILYGVCGEGLGHASRSRILIQYLKKRGYTIRIVAGGKAYTILSQEFDYVEKIESGHFVYKNNEAQLLHTIFRNLYRTLMGSVPSFFKVKKIIDDFNPDIIITDADPISNTAGLLKGIKRLSIDNPHAMLYRKYKVGPGEFFAWIALFLALKITMFPMNTYIIYDFLDEQIQKKRVLFLKPLIQEGIRKQKPVYGKHIFVYQTVGSDQQFIKILKQIKEHCIIYGYDKDAVDEKLVFKRFNENDFYRDISQAKAIITNGGFTVISEALYLKKPVFSLPIKNQFEQILNGKFVEQLGAGVYQTALDKKTLKKFLQHLDMYKSNLSSYDPGNQEETLQGIEQEIQKLLSAPINN